MTKTVFQSDHSTPTGLGGRSVGQGFEDEVPAMRVLNGQQRRVEVRERFAHDLSSLCAHRPECWVQNRVLNWTDDENSIPI